MSAPVDMQEVRARLAAACATVGFPAPTDSGLGRWADECLDTALAPRGSIWWIEGSAYVMEALEIALHGPADASKTIETLLQAALGVVRRRGRPVCECASPGALIVDRATGRKLCCKCLARRA